MPDHRPISRLKEVKAPLKISSLIVMIIVLPACILGGYLFTTYVNDQAMAKQEQELEAMIEDLEVTLNMHLMILDSLDPLIRSGDIDTKVTNYFHDHSGFLTQTAPGFEGVVIAFSDGELFTYPEEFNDTPTNWEEQLKEIPEVEVGISRMMGTGEAEIMGPFEFNEGTQYLVAAQPIMNGTQVWGYQALILNMKSIFFMVGLMDPEFDLDIQFKNDLGDTFFGEDLTGQDHLINGSVQIRNVEWEIIARSSEGLTKESITYITTFIIGEAIVTILIGIVAFSIAYSHPRLNKMMTSRTKELEERSRSLSDEIVKRERSQNDLAKANLELEESLKEVNSFLKLSRLHIEGNEGLGEIFGKAVKIIEHDLLTNEDECACIRFDGKNHMVDCDLSNRIIFISKIYVKGKERGAIEIRCTDDDPRNKEYSPSKRERRFIDSITGQLGAIAERWYTQQKEMEARNRAQFYLDLMSHDINNMHQGILINLEMLKMGIIQGEKKKDSINTSMGLINRSIKLVSNVKLLSYLKDLREPLRAVELNGSIVESVKEVKASFAGRDMSISVDMSADRMYIMADRLVGEVFINILHNGIKVQKEDPAKMKIEVVPVNDRIRVSISDHGSGIRDSDKGSLFERHTGKKRDKMMSGIGLSLVNVLMDRYRGRVWIEDRIRGRREKGAKFVLEFQMSKRKE